MTESRVPAVVEKDRDLLPAIEPDRQVTDWGRSERWWGSTYEGWLCDSILKVTAQPSPTSTTPAFSPMPASSRARMASVVVSPKRRRCTLEDL